MRTKLWLISALSLLYQNTILAQETTIRGFADVNFFVSDKPSDHAAFSLGQYDLYITSELNDRLSFLGEIVFEYDEGFIVDVERVLIKYEWDNFFNVIVGKHHTPIGFWNTAYHHGSLLQATIQRPLLFRFEDEGGILPIHTTGILFQGSHIGRFKFGYDFMIGNGVGSTPVNDNNDAKSITLALHTKPIDGLQLGVSGYWDRIAAGTLSLQGAPIASRLKQQILTATLVYLKRPYELLAEFVHVKNKMDLIGAKTTYGFYVYGGYRFDKITPYLRYDEISYQQGEQYYIEDDTKLLILGLRYDLGFLTTVKIEYHHLNTAIAGASNHLVTQIAVGF